MKYFDYMDSPIGRLLIAEENNSIICISLEKAKTTASDEDSVCQCTAVIGTAKKQLTDYFSGICQTFDLPLAPVGTPFQKKVWEALCTIPYGETQSYKDIAILVENPKGFRAIGMANNKNPIMIVIPCHRVIGTNGSLTGYAGGLNIKKWLLEHEQNHHLKL